MIDEDRYRVAWMEMRKKERRNPRALQHLLKGRPRGVQAALLELMTKDVTCGDLQTALRNEYEVERTTEQVAAALCQMKKAGRVKTVDKIVGIVIWRKV
jgi:hypothetical protein